MDYQEAVVGIEVLFDRNPAYGSLYAAAIAACEQQIPEEEAVALIESSKTSLSQIQDGASVLATLVRRNAIKRTILVNGEAYEGTIEDLQNDEDLPDEITVEYVVQATDAGLDCAETFRQFTSPEYLFNANPEFVEGYKVVLRECMAEDGKTTKELQEILISEGHVEPGANGAQKLHASYFTGKLEKFNALVWDRKRWRTTPKGASMIGASK